MKEKRHQLIVIEGADAVGKTTQIELLKQALAGEPVRFGKFPRREGLFGKVAYECLAGLHGDFVGLSPYLAGLPYMGDQASARGELTEMLARGHVILDRYVPVPTGASAGNWCFGILCRFYRPCNDCRRFWHIPPRACGGKARSRRASIRLDSCGSWRDGSFHFYIPRVIVMP